VDLVRSIGADHVVDYTVEDFTAREESFDFILDNVSNRSLADLRRVLARKGTLVPNSGQFDHRWLGPMGRFMRASLMSLFVSQKLRPFYSSPNQEDLIALKGLLESGKVTPKIDRTYPLSEAVAAMRRFSEGHVGGKVVITVA
jgi:NADPH:quinone reductase-like Zn-dependent oxidoreductase